MTVLKLNYELPPSRQGRAFASSLVVHAIAGVAILGLFRWLPSPRIENQQSQTTTLYAPAAEAQPPAAPKIIPPPPKVLARLDPPKISAPVNTETPKPPEALKPFETAKIPEPPAPKPEPKREVVTGAFKNSEAAAPVHAKKEVVTDSFSSGGAAQATLQKPAREVQTGGFGDPNGVKGVSDKKSAVTVASMGGFDLPAGSGNGNGSGGARGAQGTVASSGFGSGTAGSGQGEHPRSGTVASTGFTQAPAAAPTGKPRTDDKPSVTPVEILFKPAPIYTSEAREIHLEGEVLVRVTFGASGNLQVEQVVRGLGHGLDEAALRAAQQIRFRPAQRNGQPYDSTALVHIVFELAN